MKKNQTKRYLITYEDGSIDAATASDLIGIPEKKMADGVDFMESDASPGKDDVMHFENLGVTSIELSSDEADKILESPGVLAVEEDTVMHVLQVEEEEEFDFAVENLPDTNQFQFINQPSSYSDGYQKAVADMVTAILNAKLGENGLPGNQNLNPTLPDLRMPLPDLRLPQPDIRFPYPIIPPQPTPWNISLVKAPQAWARGLRGEGIKVAVLDTGIAPHPDLVISGGVSFIPGVISHNDGHSHGTHCAGIIGARNNRIGVVGVAPRCSLYAVKVLADSGSGNSSWIIAGMEWCIRNGMKVASMSLGGSNPPMVAYATAVKRCQDNGVTVVVASGNSYGTSFPWVCAPANSFTTGVNNASPIAVGSVDERCQIASSSSRGGSHANWNQVQVVAPGVRINSTILNKGYGTKSGTSMACPHVAGLAALLCQRYPGITPANIKRRISTTSTDLGTRGFDTTYGFGLINCDRATS
jgi:subtilisin